MKYWVYLDGEVPGSYTPEDLAAMPGFGEASLVCPAEGEIQDRNWRRAGQFSDILDALRRSLPGQAQAAPRSPQDLLDDASRPIFLHVTDLMKELENRREEKTLTEDFKRQAENLKKELLATRERIQHLEGRASLVKGFEDREKKFQELLAQTRAEVSDLKTAAAGFESQINALRAELEQVRGRETSLANEVKRHTQITEELSKQLGEKEATLARAFGIIRKLEETLGTILPHEGHAQAQAPQPSPAPPERPPSPILSPAPQPPRETRPPEPPDKPASIDSGEPEAPIEWPPEGEVKPLPGPLQTALEKILHWRRP